MDHRGAFGFVASSGNRQVVVTVSSTGRVRGKGELLRAVAVRLAIVGGLAVAAWLAGAVTANAAGVSARAGDPSPSAVSKQGEQSMDAPARAGTYGSADPAAAGTATADHAVSGTDPATSALSPSTADTADRPATAAAQSAASQATAQVPTGQTQSVGAQSFVAGSRVPTVDTAPVGGVSTQQSARPHYLAAERPWSTSGSRPAARPATTTSTFTPTSAQPVSAVADQLCAQAMADAVPARSGSDSSGASAPPGPGRDDSTADDSTSDNSTADQSTSDDSTADDSSANGSYSDDWDSGDWAGSDWSDGWGSGEVVDQATWPSNPVTGADDERAARPSADPVAGALLSGPADVRLDPASSHVSRAVARSGQPQRALRAEQAVDSTGAPALPRPEPEPQPVPLAPPIPSASPSGHQGNGGPRGVLAVLPAQPASAGTAALDQVRFVGSVPVPGVQDQPIASPD